MKKLVYLCALGGMLYGQEANPTQRGQQPPPSGDTPVAIFRVTVVSRTTPAINYQHRNGATGSLKVTFIREYTKFENYADDQEY